MRAQITRVFRDPGAGDDEDRSVRDGDRFALALVEHGQELFMVCTA